MEALIVVGIVILGGTMVGLWVLMTLSWMAAATDQKREDAGADELCGHMAPGDRCRIITGPWMHHTGTVTGRIGRRYAVYLDGQDFTCFPSANQVTHDRFGRPED